MKVELRRRDAKVGLNCTPGGGTKSGGAWLCLNNAVTRLEILPASGGRLSILWMCPTHWAQLRPLLMRALLEAEI